MKEAEDMVKLAKTVLGGQVRDVMDILKWKRIDVRDYNGDTDHVWIDFRTQRDARDAAEVLEAEGYDARQHSFKKDSVIVQF